MTQTDFSLLLQLSFSRAKIMCYQSSQSPTQQEEADMAKRKISSTQICYRISLVLLPIMLGLSLLYQAGIFIPTKIFPPCMFHALTGFSCPGCGSTRAVSALLRGDLLTSLKLQPAIFYCALVYTAFVLSHTLALLINGTNHDHQLSWWFPLRL